MPTRRACLASLLASLAAVSALATIAPLRRALAQSWPQRPVRIIVPFPPGGNTDGIARIFAQRFGEIFSQQFVVENRPGASGALAAEAVARSPADGNTLLMATLGQSAIVPAVTRASFNPLADFAPISKLGTNPFVLVVHQSVPVKTLPEFVDYVRAQPNKVTFAAAGTGDLIYLAMSLFLKRAGLEMIPVMYKGGAPALADVVAGHVQTYFSNLSDVVPHAASGAIRPLAVSSDQRLRQFPDVPTFSEAGYPGFRILTWNGLMAPIGTPKEIVDRLADESARAAKDPKVIERLANFGIDPLGNRPEEFAASLAADIRFWADAAKSAGVQPTDDK
jgi:tripartite-type tricarboxylate transporter receptor subunit TctC